MRLPRWVAVAAYLGSRGPFHSGEDRRLVVKARMRDLRQYHSGALSRAEVLALDGAAAGADQRLGWREGRGAGGGDGGGRGGGRRRSGRLQLLAGAGVEQ